MLRLLWVVLVLVVLLVVVAPKSKPTDTSGICAGPPLASLYARNEALENGYEIHPSLDCITQRSYESINAQRLASEQAQAVRVAAERKQLAQSGAGDFLQARHGFRTRVAIRDEQSLPLPQPPAELFVRSDYKNPQNYALPGFVTPDPGDGRRHAAILWLTGGDSNSLGDFWTPGPQANDQSARAFREAGLIMAFPTLRGGNGNASAKEAMLGEVDDVLAAAEQLARLSYVDPEHIYLGGHSTGGTLALLTAETKTPFRAVFAFGPVSRVDRYTEDLFPVDFSTLDTQELRLRSPLYWLDGIAQTTFIIEGETGNRADFEQLCKATRNPLVRCIQVRGADHFSVIYRATRVIAQALKEGNAVMNLRDEDF